MAASTALTFSPADLERMDQDVWEYNAFDLVSSKQLNRKVKASYRRFDFRIIKNPDFRNEVRDYYKWTVTSGKRKLNMAFDDFYRIHSLAGFLNTLNKEGSLLQYSQEYLYKSNYKYLQENGYVTQSITKALHSNQEIHEYIEDGDHLLQVQAIYRFLVDRKFEALPFFEKNVWRVEDLPYKVEQQLCRKRSVINFNRISQTDIRDTFKKYIYERLKVRKLSTVYDDMKTMHLFSSFLEHRHPEIAALKDVNRKVIVEYFSFLNRQHFAASTEMARKGQLRTFFEVCYYLGLGDVPKTRLIFLEDYKKKVEHLITYIPDNVMEQLDENIDDLPETPRNIVLLMEHVGLRVDEACRLKKECLCYDSSGDPFIEYYQYKTDRYNRIPISDKVADLLKNCIAGAKGDYLFTCNGHPYPQESVSRHLNYLAYNHKISDGSGRIWRFRCHQFRHTVAMRYARAGMSPNMIRMMLGHTSIRSIIPYLTLSDALASEKLNLFYEHEEEQFEQTVMQGSFYQKKKDPVLLTNGYCENDDLCETALTCYACGIFSADSQILEAYLKAVKRKKYALELEGYARQAQIYGSIESAITRKLEECNGKNGQNCTLPAEAVNGPCGICQEDNRGDGKR